LADDPTAPNDLAEAYLEPLVAWLAEIDARVSSEVQVEAAEDALLALIRNPRSYSPERQTLKAYLRMSARGDMRNLLAKERRHKNGQVSWKRVELSPDAGKYLGREDDPSLPMQLAEEDQSERNSIPDSLRKKLSKTDLRGMELILRKERRNEIFVELYGLRHLPAKEQFRQVKRIKDRLKKVLERAGRKV
jgi:hypothetical protein